MDETKFKIRKRLSSLPEHLRRVRLYSSTDVDWQVDGPTNLVFNSVEEAKQHIAEYSECYHPDEYIIVIAAK